MIFPKMALDIQKTSRINVGDLVQKDGPFDEGLVGLVLEITSNSLGNSFVKVLSQNGEVKTWYTDLVKVFKSVLHVT